MNVIEKELFESYSKIWDIESVRVIKKELEVYHNFETKLEIKEGWNSTMLPLKSTSNSYRVAINSCDYSDRTSFVLRAMQNYSSPLKLSYSYFLSFIFISLVRASSEDSVILLNSDKDLLIDWIISREISKLGKKV